MSDDEREARRKAALLGSTTLQTSWHVSKICQAAAQAAEQRAQDLPHGLADLRKRLLLVTLAASQGIERRRQWEAGEGIRAYNLTNRRRMSDSECRGRRFRNQERAWGLDMLGH